MKLHHHRGPIKGVSSEYLCELTTELDVLSGSDWFYHYIIIDDYAIKNGCLPIRVHGGTVGGLDFDENHIITDIAVDTDYVVKTYPANVNEIIQKYIGQKVEWQKERKKYELQSI